MYQIVSTCRGGGYFYCRTVPPHPKANTKGLYPLHRVLAENKIGRALMPNEEVHHADEVKSNNLPANLDVLLKGDHTRIHHPPKPDVSVICASCGCEFNLKPRVVRLRMKRNSSRNLFCSRACLYEFQKP